MEVIKAPGRQYAFTLRKTKNPKDSTDQMLFDHITTLCYGTGSSLVEHVYELKGGIHMHGIIEIKTKNLNMFRVRGWHLHLEELYNAAGWRFYMMKERKVKQDNKSLLQELGTALGTQNSEKNLLTSPERDQE